MTPVGVTVIGGFLGAGKTTLVNRLLETAGGVRVAVLVNDFGAINVDSALVTRREEGVIALANGCVCCSLQRDLVGQLDDLSRATPAFEHIVIETSGVSDPAEVQRALGYPQLRDRVRTNGVVTVLDVTRADDGDASVRALMEAQLVAADFVVLGHADEADGGAPAAARARCAALGVRTFATTETDSLWNVLLARVPTETASYRLVGPVPAPAATLFESWALQTDDVYTLAALRSALSSLPADVYRAKGFLRIREAGGEDCEVQVVGDRVDVRRTTGDPATRVRALVFIGRRGSVDWVALDERLTFCRSMRQGD